RYYTVRSGMELSNFFQDNEPGIEAIRKEFSIGPDDFVIGNISRLELLKGHSLLLRAFKILREQEKDKSRRIILMIIGDGEEKDNIYQDIKKLGLEKSVILKGYRNDIPNILATIDLLVHTSFREGLPRVLVQAAATGIPMVAFNVDGIPEIIRDGYNGFLVEPKNINQLVEKITIYLRKPELLKMHGDNSKKVVKNRWTIEGMVKGTDKIYSKLIEEKISSI
ncbi:MAG TPA: glycosyltransferase, partial [Atribacterota bacterium]|nr:glycosyltransferase [Atribacterota bacterium]